MGLRGEATKRDAEKFLHKAGQEWYVAWHRFFNYQNEHYSDGSWKAAVVEDFWRLLFDYEILSREPHGQYTVLTANGQFKRPRIFVASLYFRTLRDARGYARAFCDRGARIIRLSVEART